MNVKRLAIAVLVAGLAWSGFWVFAAWQTRGATENWFADRRAAGWEASYSDLAVRGFPNRVDRTFTDLVLADPRSGVIWEAPFFQVFQLSYKPGHLIAAWPETHVLTTPGGQWQITGQGQRASVVQDATGLDRANFEAETLNITTDDGRAAALAGLRAALHRQDDDATAYRLAATVTALSTDGALMTTPGLPGQANALQIDALLRFDAPIDTGTVPQTRPQPRAIDLRLAQYSFGDLDLRLAGTLDIDAGGTPTGKLTVRAQNWRAMIRAARQSGHLPPGLADAVEQGLGLIAGLSGSRDTIDLPLTFADGQTRLGPIPLGPAPKIRLP